MKVSLENWLDIWTLSKSCPKCPKWTRLESPRKSPSFGFAVFGTVIANAVSWNPSRPGFQSPRAARGDSLASPPKWGVLKDTETPQQARHAGVYIVVRDEAGRSAGTGGRPNEAEGALSRSSPLVAF